MSRITNNKVAYGKSQGLIDIFNSPIVSLRDPNGNDKGSIGQLWTNKVLNTVWMLTSFTGGLAVWSELDNSGAITQVVWTTEAGAAINMTNNHGYILTNAGAVTLTLPAVSPVGSVIEIISQAGAPWRIFQNAGQTIIGGGLSSTAGAGVRVTAAHNDASAQLITRTANTTFAIVMTNDNLNIV